MNKHSTFKALLTAIFSIAVMASASHSAHAVKADKDSLISKNFQVLSRNFRNIGNVDDNDELLELLQESRALTVENKDEVPSFMKADTAEYQEYRDAIDEFLLRIDAMLEFAEAGDTQGAIDHYNNNVRGSKRDFHRQFNIEESRR